jgi:hypothetical protein
VNSVLVEAVDPGTNGLCRAVLFSKKTRRPGDIRSIERTVEGCVNDVFFSSAVSRPDEDVENCGNVADDQFDKTITVDSRSDAEPDPSNGVCEASKLSLETLAAVEKGKLNDSVLTGSNKSVALSTDEMDETVTGTNVVECNNWVESGSDDDFATRSVASFSEIVTKFGAVEVSETPSDAETGCDADFARSEETDELEILVDPVSSTDVGLIKYDVEFDEIELPINSNTALGTVNDTNREVAVVNSEVSSS